MTVLRVGAGRRICIHVFDLCQQLVEFYTSSDWGPGLQQQGANIYGLEGNTMNLYYPFIVNNREIREGDEVVLGSSKASPPKEKKRPMVNAFDQLWSKYSRNAAPKSAASAST